MVVLTIMNAITYHAGGRYDSKSLTTSLKNQNSLLKSARYKVGLKTIGINLPHPD